MRGNLDGIVAYLVFVGAEHSERGQRDVVNVPADNRTTRLSRVTCYASAGAALPTRLAM